MKVGDVVTVVEKNASGWYKGECNGAVGLFPSNYTELVVVAAMDDEVAKVKIEELKAKRVSRLQARYSAVETTPDTAASTIQRLVRSKTRTRRDTLSEDIAAVETTVSVSGQSSDRLSNSADKFDGVRGVGKIGKNEVTAGGMIAGQANVAGDIMHSAAIKSSGGGQAFDGPKTSSMKSQGLLFVLFLCACFRVATRLLIPVCSRR